MGASAQRDDPHRPSVINPDDYVLVALFTIRELAADPVGAAAQLAAERQMYLAHRERTGATMSQHVTHGGCMVCGAGCVDYAIFHHVPTNTYIETGFDCAEKLDMGDARRFRDFRTARKQVEELQKGRTKAQGVLAQCDLNAAWSVYEEDSDARARRFDGLDRFGARRMAQNLETLVDLVDKLVRYGDLSEKQWNLLEKLVDRVESAHEEQRERDAERAQAEPAPAGRAEVTGTVLKAALYENGLYDVAKMTVKDDRGFLVFVSVPRGIQEELGGLPAHGQRVTFRAALSPKDDDPLFAFAKKPTKAQCLDLEEPSQDDACLFEAAVPREHEGDDAQATEGEGGCDFEPQP